MISDFLSFWNLFLGTLFTSPVANLFVLTSVVISLLGLVFNRL